MVGTDNHIHSDTDSSLRSKPHGRSVLCIEYRDGYFVYDYSDSIGLVLSSTSSSI